jgi:hypothetical protein
MLWSDHIVRLTGAVLIVLAVCILFSFIFGIAASDVDPAERAMIDDLLVDIEDNRDAAILSLILSVIDGVLGAIAAAAMYLLFRDRSRLFALLGLTFLLVAQAPFVISDISNLTLIHLASDFAEGGPEGIDAGSPAILGDARAVALIGDTGQILGISLLGLSILVFGAIIGWAPAGAVNPPRWLGWLAATAGVAGVLAWLIFLGDFTGIFFAINGFSTLIWLLVFGFWLLTRDQATSGEPTPSKSV